MTPERYRNAFILSLARSLLANNVWIRECTAEPYGKFICLSPLRNLERGIECGRSVFLFSNEVGKSFLIGRFLDWLCRRLQNSSARMSAPSPLMASQDRVLLYTITFVVYD
jgi:hypothetical protein